MKHWTEYFNDIERDTIFAARDITKAYSAVQLPGVNLLRIISKFIDVLEDYNKAYLAYIKEPVVQQVAWSEKDKTWRDVMTGVLVELGSRPKQPFASPPDEEG